MLNLPPAWVRNLGQLVQQILGVFFIYFHVFPGIPDLELALELLFQAKSQLLSYPKFANMMQSP